MEINIPPRYLLKVMHYSTLTKIAKIVVLELGGSKVCGGKDSSQFLFQVIFLIIEIRATILPDNSLGKQSWFFDHELQYIKGIFIFDHDVEPRRNSGEPLSYVTKFNVDEKNYCMKKGLNNIL